MHIHQTNVCQRDHYETKLVPVLALFFTLSACQGPGGSRFRSEWPQIVERARARVLAELPNLDNTSREMVLTCDPKLRAVTFPFGGDYTFVWMISSNRTAELDADSDYRNVDGRPVAIRERRVR